MFPNLRSNSSTSTSGFYGDLLNFTMCQGFEYGRIVFGVFSMLFFVLGFTAYIVLLFEGYRNHKSGSVMTPNVFFMLNLSVMDIVFLVFLPIGLINHFFGHIWKVEEIWNGTYALSVCGRPLLMAFGCIDCYLAVVYPIFYRSLTTLTPRIAVTVVAWFLTIALGLAFGLDPSTYLSIFSVLPYFVSVIIIISCDSFILHTLMKTTPGGKNKSIHPQKQRAIQTLTNSLVVAVVSYIPPVFIFFIGTAVIKGTNLYYCVVTMPMTVFSTMGSAVMPLLLLGNVGGFNRVKHWCSKIL